MLRLGTTQVKQVAHRAPNENPSRRAGHAGATPQVVYMTCRAFMRRSADLTGGRRASLAAAPDLHAARTMSSIRRARLSSLLSPSHHLSFPRGCGRADHIVFLCANPERGVGGAPGGAHWSSVTLARRDNRVATRGASRCDRDGATRRSTVAISGRGTTLHLRQCHRIHVATCPPARSQHLADGVPHLPRRGSPPPASGRHSPLRLQDRLRRRPS